MNVAAAVAALSIVAASACAQPDVPLTRRESRARYLATDSMGVAPAKFVAIPLRSRPELVENSASRQVPPRFGYDDHVGVEPAHDRRDIEGGMPVPSPAFDTPVGVERGEREFR